MQPKQVMFTTINATKIEVNGSTLVLRLKSQAGTIWVKYTMTAQKGQNRKKIS